MNENLDYNTQRNTMKISEYGRNIQRMIEFVTEIEDAEKRNRMAQALINIMSQLNPDFKDLADFKQKLWDHLVIISDFKINVESPFPAPTRESVMKKPETVPYPSNHIKFRFYGRNLQLMVKRAALLEDGEVKTELLNLIASFMKNSCRNWNNENLTPEAIAEHINMLSQGKLKISPETLTISSDSSPRPQQMHRKTSGSKNYKGGKYNKNKPGYKNPHKKTQ